MRSFTDTRTARRTLARSIGLLTQSPQQGQAPPAQLLLTRVWHAGIKSPLKNPQTASIARPHLRFWRAGTASFRYSTYWFLAVFAHAYTPSCCRAIACR
ncbi:hypothetical protein BRN46_18880 [Xanthomonas oryzae pv. oryzae]|nr:hypothetical protein BRN46_18880 [Xanthomonas oryzae pv. oryzae]